MTKSLATFLALVAINTATLYSQSSGTVGGTISFISGTSLPFDMVGYGAHLSFTVKCGRLNRKETADENGDFQISLPSGEWHLVRVLDTLGHEVTIERTQARDFRVRSGKHARFDIMVRKSQDGKP